MRPADNQAGHDLAAVRREEILDPYPAIGEGAYELLVVLSDLLPELRSEVAVDRPGVALVPELLDEAADEIGVGQAALPSRTFPSAASS